MEAPKEVLTESSLDDQLRSWRRVVVELPGGLKEGRDNLRTNNSEAIASAYQWAFQQTKQGEEQLQRYENELENILAILSKDKMRRYCELRARDIREGGPSYLSRGLSKLRLGFERPERKAQPKINQLLEVIHECETALSLYRNHLEWVETVAWEQGISLPEEDQAAPDQQQKTPVETDEVLMSGKVATQIAKNHNYPDKDITAVCIAVACGRDGITDRLGVARKLKRGAGYYYKNARRKHFVETSWLRSENGPTGFSSHLGRLRKKADSPKYKASDGTTMADSIRKHYKVPEKYSLP